MTELEAVQELSNRPQKRRQQIHQLGYLLWACTATAVAVKADWGNTVSFGWTVAVLPAVLAFFMIGLLTAMDGAKLWRYRVAWHALCARYSFYPNKLPSVRYARTDAQRAVLLAPWHFTQGLFLTLLAAHADGLLPAMQLHILSVVQLLPFSGVVAFSVGAYREDGQNRGASYDDLEGECWPDSLFYFGKISCVSTSALCSDWFEYEENKHTLDHIGIIVWTSGATLSLLSLIEGTLPQSDAMSVSVFAVIWVGAMVLTRSFWHFWVSWNFKFYQACWRNSSIGLCNWLMCLLRPLEVSTYALWVILCIDALRSHAMGATSSQLASQLAASVGWDNVELNYCQIAAIYLLVIFRLTIPGVIDLLHMMTLLHFIVGCVDFGVVFGVLGVAVGVAHGHDFIMNGILPCLSEYMYFHA